MTDKGKIITIYSCAALISALILFIAFWIRGGQVKPEVKPYYSETSELKPLLTCLLYTSDAADE